MYPIPDLVSICFSVGLTWCVLMYKYQYTNNYHTSWSWGKWRGHSDFERSIIKMGFEDKALVVTESLQGLPYWGGKMMSWTTVAKAMIAQSSSSTYTCRRRVLNTWFWWCWKLIEWSHVNFHICYIFFSLMYIRKGKALSNNIERSSPDRWYWSDFQGNGWDLKHLHFFLGGVAWLNETVIKNMSLPRMWFLPFWNSLGNKSSRNSFLAGWFGGLLVGKNKQTNKQTNKQASKQANKQTNKQQTLTQTKIIHPNHEMLKTRPQMPFVGSPGPYSSWKCWGSDAKVRFAFCNALGSNA